jgi:[ribosomal protein S18]-alanine N-acetyltransferase
VYAFRPITASDAEEISRWRYPEPYATYDGDPSSVPGLLNPRYNYHAVTGPGGDLVGYFCFGADATVPAGRKLGLYDEDALDVGLGMRPDLTGRGLGPDFVRAGLRFAGQAFSPSAFRLTVAVFNRRAIKVYEAAGFERIRAFRDRGTDWLLMRRPARPAPAREAGDEAREVEN